MLCITLPAIGLAKLDPPQDLGATPIPGRAAIRLDWKDRATGESRYVIQRIPVGTAGTESWERIELEPDSEGYVDQSVSFESPAFVYRVFAESGLEKSPSAEVSACHPKPDANELIVNGHMECIEHPGDSRSRPIGWEMGPTGPHHRLAWETAPRFWTEADAGASRTRAGKLLRVEQTTPEGNVRWVQALGILLEPNSWYRVSLELATTGTEPALNPDGTVATRTKFTAAGVVLRDPETGRTVDFGGLLSHVGPELAEWDKHAWVYRTYRPRGPHGPRKLVRYFRTWNRPLRLRAIAQTYTTGVLYVDNLSLKRVESDASLPPLPRGGTIDFIQHRGEDFFPIILWLQPWRDGIRVPVSEFLDSPFNVLGHNRFPPSGVLRTWPDGLGLMLSIPSFLYPDKKWHNDPGWSEQVPGSGRRYRGAENLRAGIETLLDPMYRTVRRNLFGYYTMDEVDCNPGTAWIDSLDSLAAIRRYIRDPDRLPEVEVVQNLCGNDAPYTGFYLDTKEYLKNLDVVSRTANLPRAYPTRGGRPPELGRVGHRIRRSVALSREVTDGASKPHLAFGYGNTEWGGDWRDRGDLKQRLLARSSPGVECRLPQLLEQAEAECGAPREPDPLRQQKAGCYLLDAMAHELRNAETARDPRQANFGDLPMQERLALWASIPSSPGVSGPLAYLDKPYNLQRFLVMHQIINGAVGAWFYTGWKMQLANETHRRLYDQIHALAKELARYHHVLQEKEILGDWAVSDDRVEILMKRHAGNLYLFAASNTPEDLREVKISVDAKYRVSKVTALNDVVNGDLSNASDRTIGCGSGSCNSFKDAFVGEDRRPKPGTRSYRDPSRRGSAYHSCLSSSGYGVHVYELQLEGIHGDDR